MCCTLLQVVVERLHCHHNKASLMGGCLLTRRVGEVHVAHSTFNDNLVSTA